MDHPNSFADVIALWPTRSALARFVNEQPTTIRTWARRNTIPERKWADVIAAAKKCGFGGVSYTRLASFERGK